ncbi:MAG: protein of unknown function YeeE/YedE [Anaerosporomusa subterranea]|jgi:uncharacterized membrane protein YedE/YeeE|nr:protein of unknown function YeeE/YedE [Anaerosporomusa subterranea]
MKQDRGWSPYLAGALSGLVSIGSVWFVGKYLGASTTFVRTAGMLENFFSPDRVANMPYFIKEVPMIDWQWMFVIGIAIGATLAAVSSGSFRWQAVPTMWQEKFGQTIAPRAAVAFIGGIVAMFGARLADGCPSGHGLSGSLQLAVSGFIALASFFIGGLITANWLYKGGGE